MPNKAFNPTAPPPAGQRVNFGVRPMKEETAQKLTHHETVGRVIQIVGVCGILIVIGIALFAWLHVRFTLNKQEPLIELLPVLLLTFLPALLVSLGKAVRTHKNWARVVAMIFGVVNLPAFPIGTVLGAYILWSLAKYWNAPASVSDAAA